MVVVGFAGGRIPEVKANYLLVKNIAVMGLQISDYRDQHPEAMRQAMGELFALYAQGKLKPLVSAKFPLGQFAKAFELIATRKAVGRLVLELHE
jgi:NADPH2:quinone reductase